MVSQNLSDPANRGYKDNENHHHQKQSSVKNLQDWFNGEDAR